MRGLLAVTFVAGAMLGMALMACAYMAGDAQAATGPHRTETQATNYLMKRIDAGTGQCVGHRTDRPHTDLYRSFVCYLKDFDADRGDAYRLDARPGGWTVRRLT